MDATATTKTPELPLFVGSTRKMSTPAQQAKAAWITILIERFPGEFAKLYRIRFDGNGRMVENRNSAYAQKHFPSLIRIWEKGRADV